MTTVLDIYEYINSIAPYATQLDYDNSGILVGDINGTVRQAMLALDVTGDVITQAMRNRCELIISHHPIMFQPIKRIPANSLEYRLANAGIALISAHTNLDAAPGGVNDCLAMRLDLTVFTKVEGVDYGIMAWLPRPMTPRELAVMVREKLGCAAVGYVEGSGEPVERVAIIGGAGGEYIWQMYDMGAQAVITGEAKHHDHLEAAERKVTLVVAGHFPTENVVITPLRAQLADQFPEVNFLLANQSSPLKIVVSD